jgi:hypothetical protein
MTSYSCSLLEKNAQTWHGQGRVVPASVTVLLLSIVAMVSSPVVA